MGLSRAFLVFALAVAATRSQNSGDPSSHGARDAAVFRSAARVGERELSPTDASVRAGQRAIESGLAWLAAQQTEAGCWTGDVGTKMMDDYRVSENASVQRHAGRGHMGVTAMCGLAFLAAGHLPDRGPYGKVVRKAVDYVLVHVADNGFISDSGTNMYSHAFAALFLAQVHGLCREKRFREGLERAVHLIVDCQNNQGGWRYYAFTSEADLSVTVCQLQALRAAYNIGIQVDKSVMDRAVEYVKRSRTGSGRSAGLFYYKVQGRGAYERNRDYAINAAAVTSLFSAGVYDEELYGPALDFVADEYLRVADYYPDHFYYWYGSYYAIQALHHAGGTRYQRFAERIGADLLRMQQGDGRWIDRVGPGDEFATAIACLVLALPWQLLPIFQR